MGTHISRVKSVDLDAWTDEQLQSVLRWGNSRANKSVVIDGRMHSSSLTKIDTGRRNWRQVTYHLKRMCELKAKPTKMLKQVQENRKFHQDQIRVEEMGDGGANARSSDTGHGWR